MTEHFLFLQDGFRPEDTFLPSLITIEAHRRLRSKSGEECIFYDETQYFGGPKAYGIASMSRRVKLEERLEMVNLPKQFSRTIDWSRSLC